jgi:hypothetical protein
MPMSRKDQMCGNCNAWMAGGGADVKGGGICRANPPAVFLIDPDPERLKTMASFPPMHGRGWCRQWQESEEHYIQ